MRRQDFQRIGRFNCFNGETDKVDKDVRHLMSRGELEGERGKKENYFIQFIIAATQFPHRDHLFPLAATD